MSEAELDRACEELRRLLALERAPDRAAVTRLFADPRHVEELYRARSTEELRTLLEERSEPAAPATEAIAAAVSAFWRWARAGFGVVAPDLLAQRLGACAGCEHYVTAPADVLYAVAARASGETKICARCGCFVAKKARRASETCPAGRW